VLRRLDELFAVVAEAEQRLERARPIDARELKEARSLGARDQETSRALTGETYDLAVDRRRDQAARRELGLLGEAAAPYASEQREGEKRVGRLDLARPSRFERDDRDARPRVSAGEQRDSRRVLCVDRHDHEQPRMERAGEQRLERGDGLVDDRSVQHDDGPPVGNVER